MIGLIGCRHRLETMPTLINSFCETIYSFVSSSGVFSTRFIRKVFFLRKSQWKPIYECIHSNLWSNGLTIDPKSLSPSHHKWTKKASQELLSSLRIFNSTFSSTEFCAKRLFNFIWEDRTHSIESVGARIGQLWFSTYSTVFQLHQNDFTEWPTVSKKIVWLIASESGLNCVRGQPNDH